MDIIIDGKWSLPGSYREDHHDIAAAIENIEITKIDEDEIIWKCSSDGRISIKKAFKTCRDKAPQLRWTQCLWKPFIQPKLSIQEEHHTGEGLC